MTVIVDVHDDSVEYDSNGCKDVEVNIQKKNENMKEVNDDKNDEFNLSNLNPIDNTSGDKRIFACQMCDYKAGKKHDITSHLEDTIIGAVFAFRHSTTKTV